MQVVHVRDWADPQAIEVAARALSRGELVLYPTDTLYALGCSAIDAAAVERLRAAKGRDASKPLPLVAGTAEQARTLWSRWPPEAALLAERFWPGPLSLVLPAVPGLPPGLGAGHSSVAARVPALALTRALCEAAGPLVSTSANLAGERPAATCEEASAALGKAVSVALDAGPAASSPSTLVDLSDGTPTLLREGAIPWSAISRLLNVRGPC
jgi:L-threonylcarbamoyladenylate synthase